MTPITHVVTTVTKAYVASVGNVNAILVIRVDVCIVPFAKLSRATNAVNVNVIAIVVTNAKLVNTTVPLAKIVDFLKKKIVEGGGTLKPFNLFFFLNFYDKNSKKRTAILI